MKKDRRKQVKTTKLKYGKDHYKKIGSDGGKISHTHFTRESGKKASQKRWELYRQQKENIETN